MKEIILIVAALIAAVAIVFLLTRIVEERDERVRQASKAYEQCIKKQYGVTPSMYYQALGEYPVCE